MHDGLFKQKQKKLNFKWRHSLQKVIDFFCVEKEDAMKRFNHYVNLNLISHFFSSVVVSEWESELRTLQGLNGV